MFEIVTALAGMMAPILSFLAEDVWAALPPVAGRPTSVFLADFPSPPSTWTDDALAARYGSAARQRAASLFPAARSTAALSAAVERVLG